MFKRNIYKWHRILSLLVALPVLLWAASGFMHPLMTTIRPNVATQSLSLNNVSTDQVQKPLQDVLLQNGMPELYNFRIVSIDANWFYQVQPAAGATPVYFSTRTGRPLINGDVVYARYLAQQFLDGVHIQDRGQLGPGSPSSDSSYIHDCCEAAVSFVEQAGAEHKVKDVVRIQDFDDEYKYVNRLLPVYKIRFDRPDGIRIYVETTGDRFAYAVDNRRAAFDRFFSLFHTWSWMDFLGKGKYVAMVALLSAAFLTTLLGVYIFFTTQTRPVKGNPVVKARRIHRRTSLFASLFTLFFTFSGAFHAWEKVGEANVPQYAQPGTKASAIHFDMARLMAVVEKPIADVRIVNMYGGNYWQVFTVNNPEQRVLPVSGAMNGTAQPFPSAHPEALYLNAETYGILPGGERKYAAWLAAQYSGQDVNDSISLTRITKFEGEYGFVNKRLPVWKVSYATNGNERYYVETGSGALATRVEDNDLWEGYSFALLHKHHFMDWGGKTVRDISTMFWAMAQIAMIVAGLILWRKAAERKRQKRSP